MDLRQRIVAALEEDLGPGDLTTEACIPAEARTRATVMAKQPLVVAGNRFAATVFLCPSHFAATRSAAVTGPSFGSIARR